MTGSRIRAQQATRPPKGARFIRGTVAALSPLTVKIAGGTAVAGLAVPGAVYAVGDAVLVAWQEPGIGPVFPLLTSPTPVPATTGAFTYAGTGANWDTSARKTSVTRSGAHGLLSVQMSVGATPPAGGATLLTIGSTPSGFLPARIVNDVAVLFNGGWNNQTAALDLGTDGRLTLQSASIAVPANAGVFVSIPFPLV